MKVYTKTGDKGTTGLLTGERVEKDSLRVEAYGTVDEINSALGLARACSTKNDVQETILKLQKMLMLLMAELASTESAKNYITDTHISVLEQTIDSFDSKLAPLKEFIVPGDNMGAAALDMARTTARRAERAVLRLSRTEVVSDTLLVVLNRLSDLCFILGRVERETI